ncbi:MAG: hypothetical protein SH848_03555 [Saprospiraceae bacterium]|nr:hypothetical protein [Saprospiraceae bacterium]MDZ4702977.1 hypothetical protein [Saprospiraceae bacterium]
MKKWLLGFIVCNLLVLTQQTGFSQETRDREKADAVYMKNGIVYRGDLLSYDEIQGLVRIQLFDGEVVVLEEDKIERIVKAGISSKKNNKAASDKEELTDVVYLKDGSVLKGLIVNYEQGATLNFRLQNGEEIVINDSEIARIVQDVREPKSTSYDELINGKTKAKPKEQVYGFRERGFYNAVMLGSLNTRSGNEFKMGLSFHNVVGFQFSQWLGIGLGLGIETYGTDDDEVIYPVFAEFRGYFNKKIKAPYYTLGAGYGFMTTNEKEFITEARGGWMLHPAIGMRFSGKKHSNLTADIGYKFQKAYFRRDFSFNGDIEIRDVLYQRLIIRVGLLF